MYEKNSDSIALIRIKFVEGYFVFEEKTAIFVSNLKKMEISTTLKELIQNKRLELGLTKTDIENKAGKDKKGKPILSVSTLSAIEMGKQKGLKDDKFQVLASILKLEGKDTMNDQRTIRVAFGPCCWAAPVINVVVKDTDKLDEPLQLQNLWLSCYADNNNDPLQLISYNQSPKDEHHILTANETNELLQNDKIDIAFLPVLTTEMSPGIIRIARCMNTVKGGVYLFIVSKKGINKEKSLLEKVAAHEVPGRKKTNSIEFKEIKDILAQTDDSNKCCFVFPRNTIAQRMVEKMLYDDTQYEKHEMEISTPRQFIIDIEKKISTFLEKPDSEYFVYAGWDFHIDKLKAKFKEKDEFSHKIGGLDLIGMAFDSHHFHRYHHPFAQISYDCVTLESKYDYVTSHPGLFKLLSLLSENVNKLTGFKHTKNNTRYRLISNFLQMEQTTTDSILNKINWEFLMYPEMFNKNLR